MRIYFQSDNVLFIHALSHYLSYTSGSNSLQFYNIFSNLLICNSIDPSSHFVVSQCSRPQVFNGVVHVRIQVGAISGAPSELKIKSSFGGTVHTKENNFVPTWGDYPGKSRLCQKTLSKDSSKDSIKPSVKRCHISDSLDIYVSMNTGHSEKAHEAWAMR